MDLFFLDVDSGLNLVSLVWLSLSFMKKNNNFAKGDSFYIMSNNEENNNNRFKCHLCPAKPYMRAEHVKCEKCNASYYKACDLRAGKQSDGSFNSCCGRIAAASASNPTSW